MDMISLRRNLIASAVPNLAEYTVTGNPVAFTTQLAKPVKSITVLLSCTQEGSGDPSPSNIRPITGVSSFTFTHNNSAIDVVFPALGKNLLKVTANSKTEAGVTYTVNTDGTITLSGTASGYSGFAVGSADIQSVQKITISGLSGNTTNIVWDTFNLYDADDTLIQSISGGGSAGNKTIDLSQYPTAIRMAVAIKRSNNVATSGTAKPMVEIGETVSTFEPYTNSVYSGSLDLVSGVLTLTHKMQTITGEEQVTYTALTKSIYCGSDVFFSDSKSGTIIYGASSIVPQGSNGSVNTGCLKKSHDNQGIQFYNVVEFWGLSELSQSALEAKLQEWNANGTPLQVVYELANPITIQLDPHSVTAIKGTNTFWTDTTGDLIIKYLDKA